MQNPIAAGRKANLPMFEAWSIDGRSKLHTEAATMTPAAKPVNARCSKLFIVFFINSTQAAPKLVPKNGISIPCIV